MNLITKHQLAEMITRQFDLTDMQREHLAHQLSLMTDKELMEEAEAAGLIIYRLRDGQFTLYGLYSNNIQIK